MPFEQPERSQQQFAPSQKWKRKTPKREKSEAFLCMHFFNCLHLSIQLAQYTRGLRTRPEPIFLETLEHPDICSIRVKFCMRSRSMAIIIYLSNPVTESVHQPNEVSLFAEVPAAYRYNRLIIFPFSCETNIIVWAVSLSLSPLVLLI